MLVAATYALEVESHSITLNVIGVGVCPSTGSETDKSADDNTSAPNANTLRITRLQSEPEHAALAKLRAYSAKALHFDFTPPPPICQVKHRNEALRK